MRSSCFDPRRAWTEEMRLAHAGRRNGTALVLTLAVLVIVTSVVVAFFALVTYDKQASASYDSSINVEQIMLAGLDHVTGQMREQIFDTAFSATNGSGANTLYIPLVASNAFPQHVATVSTLTNVLTMSGLPMYHTSSSDSGGTNLASTALTTTTSRNQRSVPLSIWQMPDLFPASLTSSLPSPEWVLVTRNGPQPFSSYAASLADSTVSNSNFVLGRYSYVVYDISGLLDINVAGYPSSDSADAPGKGGLAWADLTKLGLSSSDISSFMAWRNPATSATYTTNVGTAAQNGFEMVNPGDTTFLSRQDLIGYAQQSGSANWTNALPYMTVFSREFNGPTWKPTTNFAAPYDYTSHEYQPTVNGATTNDNVFIMNSRVQTAFTRDNGAPAVVGEPLVKYRFPLDKLALLEKMQGVSTLTAQDKTDIARYFGLDPVTDSVGYYRHWNYPTSNTTFPHTQGRVLTLDEVAALTPAREPDFFELLQAGMLQGSLGYSPTFNYPTNTRGSVRGDARALTKYDIGNSITYQVMQIGANIIDQWDADSYPADITFQVDSSTTVDIAGIEDLPYINEFFVKMYGDITDGYTVYGYCELWNPHTANSVNASLYPTSLEVEPEPNLNVGTDDSYQLGYVGLTSSGATVSSTWSYFGGDPTTTAAWHGGTPPHLFLGAITGGGAVQFTTDPTGNYYREPSLITGGSLIGPPPGWTGSTPVWTPTSAIGGWNMGSLPAPSSTMAPTTTGGPATWAAVTAVKFTLNPNFTLPIKYKDLNNVYHTYSTFIGLDNAGLNTGYGFTSQQAQPPDKDLSFTAWSIAKSDPRTSRYGGMPTGVSGTFYTPAAGVSLTPALCNSAATLNSPTLNNPPFYAPAHTTLSTLADYRLDLWTVNDPAITSQGPIPAAPYSSSYYPDSDGAYRPGDVRNSYPNNSPLYTGNTATRPVMLNRPFRSVAELGYTFRDSPWKTIDFTSPNSADTALLDLFSIGQPTVEVGRLNPNTPYQQVLSSVINGTTQSVSGGTTVTSATADAAAAGILATSTNAPFMNRGDIVATAMTNAGSAVSTVKNEREAVVRSLADVSNTRTWNLLIDMVGQAGRYPPNATSLDDFVVTGQRHYWLHVAIDRYTGAVVDREVEAVSQ